MSPGLRSHLPPKTNRYNVFHLVWGWEDVEHHTFLSPTCLTSWCNKRHVVGRHVYVVIHVKDPQLSAVRVGSSFCLPLSSAACAEWEF